MRFGRWDVLIVAAVAASSAAVFAGLGLGPARADGPEEAEWIRTSLEKAQKVELGGCRLSACPAEVQCKAGVEQQIVLRATNPTGASVVLSLTVSANEIQFMMSRVAMPVKDVTNLKDMVKELNARQRTLELAVEPGKTAEARVTFNLPAGTYSITAMAGRMSAGLCVLTVAPGSPKAAAGVAGPENGTAAKRQQAL